jgi:SWI/SNF-related matrix-associated actin-dependent regulator 1 of chromatin subfamily A
MAAHPLRKRSQGKPHLIVVPGSTLGNWRNELERFCPSLRVVVYHGSPKEKQHVRHLLKRALLVSSSHHHGHHGSSAPSEEDEIHIVLATYTMFERESGAEDRALLKKMDFDYLVLDEAHCIKNSSSSRYFHLRNLRTHRRLLLSGTPVQNDVTELLALLGFLMPQVKCSSHLVHSGGKYVKATVVVTVF